MGAYSPLIGHRSNKIPCFFKITFMFQNKTAEWEQLQLNNSLVDIWHMFVGLAFQIWKRAYILIQTVERKNSRENFLIAFFSHYSLFPYLNISDCRLSDFRIIWNICFFKSYLLHCTDIFFRFTLCIFSVYSFYAS